MKKYYFQMTTFLLYLILCLVFVFVANKIWDKPIEAYTTKPLTILNLVLFSHDDNGPYDTMQQMTSRYYKRFPNVHTVYYTYKPDIDSDFILDKDILYIKGNETYIPGILEKTVQVFDYYKDKYDQYDYIIRSNISTIIQFDLLVNELVAKPLFYGSGYLFTEPTQEITDKVYPHLSGPDKSFQWGSGTSMIFTKESMKFVLDNAHYLYNDYNHIIDDVAISLLFQKHYPSPNFKIKTMDDKFWFVPYLDGNYDEMVKEIQPESTIFYRNHCGDRQMDCIQMKHIIRILETKSF